MTIGIYKLVFKGTNKVYIGKSNDIKRRTSTHLSLLKNSKHYNTKLSEAYTKYGTPVVEILQECDIESLSKLEEELIREYNSVEQGFNILSSSYENYGSKGELHGMSKFTNNQIVRAFSLLVENIITAKEIAEITGVSLFIVKKISSLTLHIWLKDVFPAKYKILEQLKNTRNKNIGMCAKDLGIIYPLIKSPEGQIFKVEHLTNFAREYNLSPTKLSLVLREKANIHRGWVRA